MKKSLAFIMALLMITASFHVQAKKYDDKRRPSHGRDRDRGKHRDRDRHKDSNSSAGEAAAIVAVALSFTTTSYLFYELSTKSDSDEKLILTKTKEDAALYIATGGQQTGAYLENTLKQLRNQQKELQNNTDMQLAQAILAI